jgi:hypothetical protein
VAHDFRHRSAASNPPPEGYWCDAEFARPVNGTESPAFPRDDKRIPFVARLLSQRCPSTVAGLVIAVVVDAIDRMLAGWSRAHVRQKVLKAVAARPALANTDSAPSVFWISWISAPRFHRNPRIVFCGLGAAMLLCPAQTSARCAVSRHQCIALDDLRSAAVAIAIPVDAAFVTRRVGACSDCQQSKSASSQVNDSGFLRRRSQAPARTSVSAAKVLRGHSDNRTALTSTLPGNRINGRKTLDNKTPKSLSNQMKRWLPQLLHVKASTRRGAASPEASGVYRHNCAAIALAPPVRVAATKVAVSYGETPKAGIRQISECHALIPAGGVPFI